MAKIVRTVLVNAPVAKVFGYLSNPANLPEIWPSMVEVKDVKPLQNGGNCFDWVYKMAGMRFEGSSEASEFVPNQRLEFRSTSGISSHFVYTFAAEGEQTRFHEEVEYSVPIPLLGKLAEAFIVKQNEHEADVFVANLKARFEA